MKKFKTHELVLLIILTFVICIIVIVNCVSSKERGIVTGGILATPYPSGEEGNITEEEPVTEEMILVTLENVASVILQYNDEVAEYNNAVEAYNTGIQALADANVELQVVIDVAESTLQKDETPYDIQTKIDFQQAIDIAKETMLSIPESLKLLEPMSVPEDSTLDYSKLLQEVLVAREEVAKLEIPEVLEPPAYLEVKEELKAKEVLFSQSVQSMLQVTAPTTDFIRQRVVWIDTIVGYGEVTEMHDPNGLLGEEGGYIACVYLSDMRVDKTKLDIGAGKNNAVDIGTKGGGAIEVYATKEDAEARNEYLASFDNTANNPGAHRVVGTLVIRTSSLLSLEQQNELTEQIIAVLVSVE